MRKLSSLFKKATKPVILLNHIPFNTNIDKINNKASPRDGQHFGSIIVRELIERYEPVLSVGGHMHEHHAKIKIGRTVCINTGYGNKVNTLITINGLKVSVKMKD